MSNFTDKASDLAETIGLYLLGKIEKSSIDIPKIIAEKNIYEKIDKSQYRVIGSTDNEALQLLACADQSYLQHNTLEFVKAVQTDLKTILQYTPITEAETALTATQIISKNTASSIYQNVSQTLDGSGKDLKLTIPSKQAIVAGVSAASDASIAYGSGINPAEQYVNSTVPGSTQSAGSSKIGGDIYKQVIYFSPDLSPWYMNVMDQIKQWKELAKPDSWKNALSSLRSIENAVGTVSDALDSITSGFKDMITPEYLNWIKRAKKKLIESDGIELEKLSTGTSDLNYNSEYKKIAKIPENLQSISLQNSGMSAKIVGTPAAEALPAFPSPESQAPLRNTTISSLLSIISPQSGGLLTDNVFDLLIERKKRKNSSEETLSEAEQIALGLRVKNVNLPGRYRTSIKTNYRGGLEVMRFGGKVEQEKLQSLTFDLDSQYLILQNILEFSGLQSLFKVCKSEAEIPVSYKRIESFITPQSDYKYNIRLYIYGNGLNSETTIESMIKPGSTASEQLTAIYVFEDVKFLGLNSSPVYNVENGEAISISTEFTYLRSYFDRKALADMKQSLDLETQKGLAELYKDKQDYNLESIFTLDPKLNRIAVPTLNADNQKENALDSLVLPNLNLTQKGVKIGLLDGGLGLSISL